MSPNYTRQGKILRPDSHEAWLRKMAEGRFVKEEHKGLVALVYYSAVRNSELRKTRTHQLFVQGDTLFYDVGRRLKRSKKTDPLPIPLKNEYVDAILEARDLVPERLKIWPYSRSTVWNIFYRACGVYPHFYRLSRITNFFRQGYTIAQVHSWTGLSLKALDAYMGLVSMEDMGQRLVH